MPVKGGVPWAKDPHTQAKHEIYRSYLSKWFPILLSDNGYASVTYAEGFAGPGVYLDGSPGSPIIALQVLTETPELRDSTKITRFLFVDDDTRCTQLLRQQFRQRFPSRPRPAELMPVDIRTGTCAAVLEPALGELGAWHQPILAVFDSWGNAPVPYHLMRRIAQNPSSEVVVTFGPQHFIRFVSQLSPDVDALFGHDKAWRAVSSLPDGASKKIFLLAQYRSMLVAAGFRYLLDFELVTKAGESLYLIFGTNHRRGLEKMKESVWEVDKQRGIGYRDPRDLNQEVLFDLADPVLAPLERLLLEQLRTMEESRVESLREFALFQTVYREQHVIPALTNLRDQNLIAGDRARLQRSAVVRLQART